MPEWKRIHRSGFALLVQYFFFRQTPKLVGRSRAAMSAPKFSVGVDADPMMVEETIDKTLEEIIKERRKEAKCE